MTVTTPFIYKGSRAHTRARRCTDRSLHTHTHAHAHTHTRTHTRTRTHAHARTRARAHARGGGTLDRGARGTARHIPWHRSKIFLKIKPDLS